MRKYCKPESGLFRPRFLLVFCLCSGGVLLALAGITGSPVSGDGQNAAMTKIAPWVLDRTANEQQAEFLVVLADQADVRNAKALGAKVEKGRHVRNELWNKAQATQGPL